MQNLLFCVLFQNCQNSVNTLKPLALFYLVLAAVGLCSYPVVGLCSYPVVGLCSYPVGLCSYPVVGLCSYPVGLCSYPVGLCS
ncbi:hypothetical protein IJJ97_01935, partial [bacterium]|nr:hypothetical protein [bacterium]